MAEGLRTIREVVFWGAPAACGRLRLCGGFHPPQRPPDNGN
jgi:hypothetical protein